MGKRSSNLEPSQGSRPPTMELRRRSRLRSYASIFELIHAATLPAAAMLLFLTALPVAAQPAPPLQAQLVPIRPDEVPSLLPQPASVEPKTAPYPAPGYARWELAPAPPDTYLDDLPAQNEGRHTGFFMRLALGPSYTTMRGQSSEGSLVLRAAGAGLNMTLGGALSENLVVYGEVALQSTLDAGVEASRGAGAAPGTSVTTAALGAGLGYYLMPSNVYLTGSLLIGQARAVDLPTERLLGKTDFGPAVALSVGKEWWMTPSWTLGLLIRAQLARFRDPGRGHAGTMWNATALSASLSATFE